MPGERPATAEEIRHLVGDVDDGVVSSIMRTEATAAQVLQAVQWFRGGGGLEDEAGHEPHGAIRAVYEILQAEEPQEP
jgi:phosphohistidine phosphatase SixA